MNKEEYERAKSRALSLAWYEEGENTFIDFDLFTRVFNDIDAEIALLSKEVEELQSNLRVDTSLIQSLSAILIGQFPKEIVKDARDE